MNNGYHICGEAAVELIDPPVETDYYIPIKGLLCEGRHHGPLLRFGNFTTSLLEIHLKDHDLSVWKFTLVFFKKNHSLLNLSKDHRVGRIKVQLDKITGSCAKSRDVNVYTDLSVAIGDEMVEIDLGEISNSHYKIVNGKVAFYVKDDQIVGLTVNNLRPDQMCDLKRFFL